MDTSNVFNLQNTGLLSISAQDILLRLFFAFLLSGVISQVYRMTHKGFSYSYHMVVGIVMCSLIVTMVLMVIDNSIARAFGLVGALSIIRFRTPIKDVKDILFLFFAIAVGIACGAGAFKIAVISTLVTVCIAYILFQLKFGQKKQDEFLLKIIGKNIGKTSQNPGKAPHEEILENYSKEFRVIEVSSLGEDTMEVIYDYKFTDASNITKLIAELNALPNIDKVFVLSAKHNLDIQ
jgi:uncharacterized membrane protein YhiD involved in acid resistance